jgi:glycosyltransferase involved in cell wall biosynthesis
MDSITNISVIVPLYNKQDSIQRSILSVLAQTFTQFELIVVDDGSFDNSYIRATEIQDERLRIVKQKNSGVSAARNRGIAEAQYEWLAFLDADDEWKPDFIEMMVDLHQSFPNCGLLGSAFIRSTESDLNEIDQRNKRYPYGWKGILENYYEDLQYSSFYTSSVVVKKDHLIKVGEFPLNLRKGEDTYTWINLYQITDFAFINKIGAVYHLEAENRSDPSSTLLNGDPRKPYSHALLLSGLIHENKIPAIKIPAAVDYMAYYDIRISRLLILQGHRREALARLWSYRSTKRYRKIWIKMFAACFLPRQCVNLYINKHLLNNPG